MVELVVVVVVADLAAVRQSAVVVVVLPVVVVYHSGCVLFVHFAAGYRIPACISAVLILKVHRMP